VISKAKSTEFKELNRKFSMKPVTRLIGIHASPDVDNCIAVKIDDNFTKKAVVQSMCLIF